VLARSRPSCRCVHSVPLVWRSSRARLPTVGHTSFVRFRRPASPRARLDGTATEGGGVDPVCPARWCQTGTIAAVWPAPPATARAAPAAPHRPVTSVSRRGLPKVAHNGASRHPLVCVHRNRSVVLARRRPRCRRRRPRARGPLHACTVRLRPPHRPNLTPTASPPQRTDHNRHPHRRADVASRAHSDSRRAHEPSPSHPSAHRPPHHLCCRAFFRARPPVECAAVFVALSPPPTRVHDVEAGHL